MITRLRATDFQRIDDLIVDFDRVTTFVGPSQSGKSSALRAIRWLATNRPSGDAFVRKGRKSAKVALTVDGVKVGRQKGKGVNRYRVGDDELKAMGADVPEPAAKLLNLADASFQTQHDAPFLFDLTAGQASQALNAVVNLGEIDETLARVASEARKAKAAVEASEERLIDARKNVETSAWATEADVELRKLEATERKTASLRDRRRETADLVAEGEKLRGRVENAKSAALEAGNRVRGLEKIARRIEELRDRRSELAALIERARSSDRQVEKLRAEADAAERKLAEFTKGKCPVCGKG